MRTFLNRTIAVLVVALVAGSFAAYGNGKDRKIPKDLGMLTVQTTPAAYPVKIDGVYKGMSGVTTPAEFLLTPGFHTLEIEGPNGKTFTKEVEIRRQSKHCICIKIVEETITKACPYRFYLEGPDRISEGDLVTFAAINSGTAQIPLRYAWTVSPGTARVTSGLGTPTITIDSRGLGGQTINASLDVNDDVYDNRCRQVISVPTFVSRLPDPEPPKPFRCDEFEARAADEDKARFDNCVIQAQNIPDAQLYVIIYPGTDRASTTRNTYERLSQRALDYMVKTRRFDPRRIQIVRGSPRTKSSYEVWIVPPGASLPVVR
ncbi:MAG: PEGA domain-containing protein [Acidobacteriota bacterium]|nr:MAG: PEGA domain-containing protein [Acidobacteriota bacterium]